MTKHSGITLRPYRLLCAVCSLGEEDSVKRDNAVADILETIRKTPDIPVTLTCNAGEVFVYQDPGVEDDTPEGSEYNMKRDLEILYKMNLFPGCTLPARIILNRLLENIEDASGICGFSSGTSVAWKGCPKADSGNYKRGREKGIKAIISPRSEQEMKREKEESLKAMYSAKAIKVRPHIMMCSVCQYGGGTRPPYPEDNLPEMLELILKEPDTLIEMAYCADWMMCGPCPLRSVELNACIHNMGSGGLPNQMRDLRVLQKLGLTYGSVIKARELYRLLLERIPGTFEMCSINHSKPSVWWSGCGSYPKDSENYEEGRKLLRSLIG